MSCIDRPSTPWVHGRLGPRCIAAGFALAGLAWVSPVQAAPPDPQPTAEVDEDPEESPSPAASPVPAEVAPIPTPAPPPAVSATPRVDDAWSPWIGRPVRLRIVGEQGERIISGRLVAHSADRLAVALDPSGQIAAVHKDQVIDVAAMPLTVVEPPPAKKQRRGTGLLIGGGVMAAAGLTLAGTGAAYVTESPSGAVGALLVVPGLGLIGGGVAMLVVGAKRHARHRERFGFARITPTLHVGRERTQAGIAVAF